MPSLLLHRPAGKGNLGKTELESRVDRFARGDWGELVAQARDAAVAEGSRKLGRAVVTVDADNERSHVPKLPAPSRRGAEAQS